jgi:hypothetical protein
MLMEVIVFLTGIRTAKRIKSRDNLMTDSVTVKKTLVALHFLISP